MTFPKFEPLFLKCFSLTRELMNLACMKAMNPRIFHEFRLQTSLFIKFCPHGFCFLILLFRVRVVMLNK